MTAYFQFVTELATWVSNPLLAAIHDCARSIAALPSFPGGAW